MGDDELGRSQTAASLPEATQRPAATNVAELRRIYAQATKGPWAIEACGEKGDGSNMIGVVFDPDTDPNCDRPLSGWLPACRPGTDDFIEYYVDETVAECEHRNRNSGGDATFIAAAYNNMDWLLDSADACVSMVGLVQLLLARDDLTPELRQVLTTNHRVKAAQDAIAKAEGR